MTNSAKKVVRLVNDKIKNMSVKKIIISIFIISMLVVVSIIGYLVFTSWFSSAKQTAETLTKEMEESINYKVNSFLYVPELINKTNHKIIANGILDLSDTEQRERFFTGVLSSYNPEVYSFSYGTANGEYYGARRNENSIIEIMRNNASTGGISWYYSVNEDMTAGNLVVQAGKFDPRTRAWYKAAVETKGPVFSPIYKHFIMNDLTVSFATPIYDKTGELQGVLGNHILLTDIGIYLNNAVSKYNGYAVIFEKDTNNLIANSMGISNFNVLQDGTLERFDINEIQNTDIGDAYEQYNTDLDPNFFYEGTEQNLYINVQEIHREGLDWVVISAIPESLLITPVIQGIYFSVVITILALLLSFLIFNILARKILMPINKLLHAADALASGDLDVRVDIARKDEIGKISESFNKVADKMQFIINNLEVAVKERTEELYRANVLLEENKNQLRLILDSSAEAIYGIDLDGNCTFCNLSCIKLLGYANENELLGKNMHNHIHYNSADGTPLPPEECKILQGTKEGKGIQEEDEVFWKSDGTSFDVEYHSFPQVKNGEIIGTVVTFMDITTRKQRENEIQYLSYHDTLTGLYNRRCFEEKRTKIDIEDNLPLSVIFADINGLKMTNDIFGHVAGDDLIKKAANIIVESCRENDVVARVGGDEFIILLPNTIEENAEKILTRIKSGFFDARVMDIKCSISLGLDTKRGPDQSLDEIITNAEDMMYKDKTLNRKSINKEIIDTIILALHSKSPREKQHSVEVRKLCVEVGYFLKLSDPEISKLKRAGYLHDIGKIILDKEILYKEYLTEEEVEQMRQHSVTGYRILNLFDDTVDLAEYIYSHHERWDGTGYPRGLKGEDIPLISRIISIVETYERVLNKSEISMEERKRSAIEVIRKGAGSQFDPHIAELFIQMLKEKNEEV